MAQTSLLQHQPTAGQKNSKVKKMWEHRTVSNKEFSTTGRLNPSETYVRLMDEVEPVSYTHLTLPTKA